MSDQTVPPKKPAGELKPGDRIAAAVLPGSLAPADVLFVYPYTGRDGLAWVFVAYCEVGYSPQSEQYLAGSLIPVEPVDPVDFCDLADRLAVGDEPIPPDADVIALGHAAEVPAAGVVQVAEGHVVHECCGKLDDGPHRSFCEHYRLPDRRTCVDPGDHEHDHESCRDANAAGDPAADAVARQIVGQGPGGAS